MRQPSSNSLLFRHSPRDALMVLGALLHAAVAGLFFVSFEHTSCVITVLLGLMYSFCVTWNVNCIAHNFIHNPFFTSPMLNRIFSVFESLVLGFSQTFYRYVHLRHHTGNNDRRHGSDEPHDWMSLYRYGKNGEVENVWSYCFLGFFRGNPKELFLFIRSRSAVDARQGLVEYTVFLGTFATGFALDWRATLCFLPFYYLGHVLSSLNGYYEHYGSTPEHPFAWGVSSYHRWYNLLWFNNGYHAEHHYRPRTHWTKMKELHERIRPEMEESPTKVIDRPHAFEILGDLKSTAHSTLRAPVAAQTPR